MINIQPQYLSFSKLLAGRLFCIPEYQRAYSWTSKERRDLFKDILQIHSKGGDAGHFMSTVVCLLREKHIFGTDEYQSVDIVDGQQRLTTLIILLNSIKLTLDKKDKREEKLAKELGDLLVKVEGEELLLLQTNHDSSHHFETFLKQGIAEPAKSAITLADREILKAIEDCQEFVLNWQQMGAQLTDLVSTLKNRLFFILHEITDEKTVYTVFEVLNNRGLDVSWIDRLKSFLMGSAFELSNTNQKGVIKDLHIIWRDIYSVIGLRQGLSTESLRFAATLRSEKAPSRPLGEKNSVEVLRAAAKNATQIRKVAAWLLSVTQACDTLNENPRLNAVTRISQSRLLATAINLRKDIEESDRNKLLARWEKVSFRIYGMFRKDARTLVGDYVRLAWRIINENLSWQNINKAIGEIGQDYTIENAVKSLRKQNCYEGWEGELRYFMFRYEEYLAKKQKLNFSNEQWEKIWMVSPADSIEHIWPKSKAPEKSKHRLGNLVLLPPRLNSKLQANNPKKKASAYLQTGLLIAGEVANIINTKGWNSKSINGRETALLNWASTEWAD